MSDSGAESGGILDSIVDFLFSTVLMVVIVLVIRGFIFQPYIVEGKSMEPTLSSGEYIIVDKISYRLASPKRGDVVVLNPDSKMPDLSYIKRVIGLPGERVIIENGVVKIVSNNKEEVLQEPYLGTNNKTYTTTFQDRLVVTLRDNEYFVLGDNRANSLDSRSIGAINREHIIGKARFILLPVAKAGAIEGVPYFKN